MMSIFSTFAAALTALALATCSPAPSKAAEGDSLRIPSSLTFRVKMPVADTLSVIRMLPLTDSAASNLVLVLEKEAILAQGEEAIFTLPLDGKLPGSGAVLLLGRQDLYSARFDPLALKDSTWTGTAVALNAQPALEMSVTPLYQQLLSVPSGEYSGIAHTEGNRYAVVHDNQGLWWFDIELAPDGTVLSCSAAPGGENLDGTDPEDVAWIPSSQTLIISHEADQSIREYGLDGRATGRAALVPADMGTEAILTNAGFEALTYCPETGLLWTTTEKPLAADERLLGTRRLHRIQSFKDLACAERYFYLSDEPALPEELSSQASAYVFGISAMTALPDGSLLVLEREVYVPSGGTLEKALLSFTRTNIYRVRPGEDSAGLLQKSLFCSFTTSALDLANYEGMCLGPVLPDGTRTLLLIPDAQNSQGGLVREYLKVILFR